MRFGLKSLFIAAVSWVSATGILADGKNPTYVDDVLPILKQSCVSCHGDDKQKGGLTLASFANMQQGGSSGAVVVAGNPDKSRLYLLMAHKDEPKMPPKADKPPDAQLNLVKLWIEQGARENAAGKLKAPVKKAEIALKVSTRGKPDGPPPMPKDGMLSLDPSVRVRRAGAVTALAASPWAPLVAVGGPREILLYHADTGDLLGFLPFARGR
jgi:mono/diheme cytochrome c family protein